MKDKAIVLGVPVDSVTMDMAVSIVERFIREKRSRLVATANAEMVMMAQRDWVLADILNRADLVVPDGAGVVWAARYLGYKAPERVAGYDLVQKLLEKSAQKDYKIYFLGGAPGIAQKAKATAENKYRGVRIVGYSHGYFDESQEDNIIRDINDKEPDILLVALGVPKQEKWLARNLDRIKVPVSIGVGGTFDVMAGTVRRAPLLMQRTNLEWLFRLLNQPTRIVRMLALPRFVLKVMYSKIVDK